ncbi:MAG TPA: hypothetical protein VG326_05615 [Tepidisphaeraceae bacterium]|jgi:hypothetical protein|nr:hypothetical protein [Tepidisphaeraceae bacterium]
MSDQMFNFDPAKYADHFAREGYVHIKAGVTEPFYEKLVRQVADNMRTKIMKEYAIGDKQQAMYEFPEGGDYPDEVCQAVAGVVGIDRKTMVLSERHIKAYDATASAEPLAHKDRYASEYSVGMSVHVREGSTLVLYPYDQRDINPFNTSQQMRASLSPDRYPEAALRRARRIEIKDAARDVIIFRGHSMWHLRANPANTTMLYLKMNSFHCDPLGEDRHSEGFRRGTLAAVELPDEKLEQLIIKIGRRVDHFHRFYDRDWREVPGVILWDEKHFTVDQDEWRMLEAIDGVRTVAAVLHAADEQTPRAEKLSKIRRLARRGVLDLIGHA